MEKMERVKRTETCTNSLATHVAVTLQSQCGSHLFVIMGRKSQKGLINDGEGSII